MPNTEKKCPYSNFKKNCIKDSCPKWIKLLGVDPQTGQHIDEYACADAWLPILIVENTKRLNELSAGVESYRNETTKLIEAIIKSNIVSGKSISRALLYLIDRADKIDDVIELAKETHLIKAKEEKIVGG